MLAYVMVFFGGVFLCNALPHLLSGLRGDPFPTPFATPRGIGNSPPLTNFLWGSANLLVSVFLISRTMADNLPHGMLVLAAGFIALGLPLSRHFGKHRAG